MTSTERRGHTGEGLVRGLGSFDATMLVIGIVIGSGIFLTTGLIARDLPSPALILTVWLLGGLLSLAGCLTFAELGAAWPRSGGLYVYLREAYGPLSGFLFGWLTFLVYQTGAIAAVAVGFAEYLSYFVPALGTQRIVTSIEVGGFVLSVSAGQLAACVAILVLTAVNVQGLRSGTVVQNGLTILKLLILGAFAILGLWVALPAEASMAAAPAPLPAPPDAWIPAIGVGLVAVLWTFDGWHNLTFAAGEVRNPAKSLPIAMIGGILVVTVIYLLVNAAYLRALPIDQMSGELRVAGKAAEVLFGPSATAFISVAVIVSTLGAANGAVLTGARVYFAMARDGLFFRAAARVHDRHRTPHVALWAQGIWACVLALSGRYDQLFTYATFAGLLIYLAAGASVFTLRAKRPDVPRPYRVPGYPIVPGLFLLAVAFLLVNTVLERPVEAFAGLGMLVLGLPVYAYWRRRAASGGTPADSGS